MKSKTLQSHPVKMTDRIAGFFAGTLSFTVDLIGFAILFAVVGLIALVADAIFDLLAGF